MSALPALHNAPDTLLLLAICGYDQSPWIEMYNDSYYTCDKNHKRAVTGTGLGLSIVRKIFELHHIRYGVTSKTGEGSTFWFEISIAA